ncbi:MAG TPA: amidase [Casimicrobiaceae bacterium]|jgi:Asp-tRNA(Asn)/Glu-tRNA(Gln) amidotransferase A subunit family amidase|nr:amidase [Casimicrobiaceae bacterium]
METKQLWSLTATELLALMRSRKCSAEEVTRSCIARIAGRDPLVRAFVDIDAEDAVRQARALDANLAFGPLHGIPIAVKDTMDVAGLHCTMGTPIHKDRIPARDSMVVQRIRESGAVIIGTTVSTEYAIARAGPTTNPHNPAHTPGGSSSGSAAAVAARMVPLALASQTVGSIIRPSTYCGIFGLKPTKGAISRVGTMTLSPFLDHMGPVGRSIDDISLACRSMFDIAPSPHFGTPTHSGLKEAILIEGPLQERIEPPTREALNRAQSILKTNGIPVQEITLPKAFREAVTCWETILFRDLAINHGNDRDTSGSQMSDRFRKIIDDGRAISDRAYEDAIAEAQFYREQLLQLLTPDAIILAPATDGTAPLFSEQTGPSMLQGLWSLAGLPSLAVPCGKVGGLPIGVQLVAQPGLDHLVLSTGRLFERFMQND